MKHYYKKILKEDTIIKKDISSKNIWLLCFAILVFSSIISFAQTGEITGYIKDNSTDEPIPFSNVVLKGTTIGAATDIDGKYRISNVPPGSYDIIASSMGYQKVTITGVVVSSNRILEANFELTPTVISTEDVVVVAERPPVDVEVASSAKMITSKDVQNMPAVTNVKDLISLQASVVKDGENIHIRGGNANEVLYLIDGVPSKNPITGVSSVEIDINQIEEVEILTGGFDAEYGNANSGVINIITKSGRDHFTADVILQSDEPFGKSRSSNYDRAYVGVSGPFSLFNLVGLPGDAGFTISTNTTLDDQFNHNPGSFGETDLYLFNAPNRQYSHYNLTGKLNYQPIKSMRIKTDFTFQKTYNKPFAWSWKNIPEEIGVNRNSFNRFTFQLNHNLGKDAYYILNVGYEKSKYKGGKDGLNSPAQAWSFAQRYYDKVKKTYVILNTPEQLKDYMNKFPGQIDFSKSGSKYLPPTSNFDFDSDGFWDLASNRDFKRNEYEYFSAGLDYTHFFGVHKFKAGVDVNFSKVKIMEIYDYSFYFPKRDSLPGAYSEYGSSRWYFNNVPWNGSMFVQDRIEYGGMFLNLGVRGDFFVHGNIVDNTSFIEAYNEATGKDIKKFKKAKIAWSPRIGLSIPASASTKLFFNYGYFIQNPSFEQLYRDPFLTSKVGNPALNPRQEISYEVGMETEFIKNWVLNAKIYGRDAGEDIGFLTTETTPARQLFSNTGFGSKRGFEVEMRKTFSDFYAFTINYTYLLARGFNLARLENYEKGGTVPPPVREERLGHDINHNLKFMFNFEIHEKSELDIFGYKLSDFGFYTIINANAGRPYTPQVPDVIYVESNSKTGPYYININADIHKGFRLGGIRTIVFLEANNLLNFKTLNYDALNTKTGEIYTLGDSDGLSDRMLTPYEIYLRKGYRPYNRGLNLKLGIKLYIR